MRGQGCDEAQSCLTEPGEAVEWGVRRAVAICVAWVAPPQKTGRGPRRWAPTSGPGRWHRSREDGLLPSPPGPFCKHSLSLGLRRPGQQTREASAPGGQRR